MRQPRVGLSVIFPHSTWHFFSKLNPDGICTDMEMFCSLYTLYHKEMVKFAVMPQKTASKLDDSDII